MAKNGKKDDSVLFMTWVSQNLNLICEIDKKSDDKMSIAQFVSEWKEKQGEVIELFNIRNPALFICSLYGLLLVPKENFWDDIPTTALQDIKTEEWGDLSGTVRKWNYKKTKKQPEDQTLRNYIKHLRNSLAHTGYECKYDNDNYTPETLVITLEDNDKKGNSFVAELPIKVILLLSVTLCKFLSVNYLKDKIS